MIRKMTEKIREPVKNALINQGLWLPHWPASEARSPWLTWRAAEHWKDFTSMTEKKKSLAIKETVATVMYGLGVHDWPGELHYGPSIGDGPIQSSFSFSSFHTIVSVGFGTYISICDQFPSLWKIVPQNDRSTCKRYFGLAYV